MPNYTFNHVHHEAIDVYAAMDFYKRVFDATSDEPFERGGATWIPVHIGNMQVTVTNREFSPTKLERYQGLDHFAVNTDDFEGSLKRVEEANVHIWFGPVEVPDTGQRIFFIDGPDNMKIEIMEQM